MNCSRTAIAILAAGLIGLAGGCGGGVSPAAFEHAKSLYTVSNLRSEPSVTLAERQIDADLEAGRLTSGEADRLRAICDQCREARWKDAQTAAMRMMDAPPRS